MDTEIRKVPLGVCARSVPSYLSCHPRIRIYPSQYRSIQLSCVRSIVSFNASLSIPLSMIPLWTIPMAAVTGNTLILKPSERDPGAAMIIAELCERSGNTTLDYILHQVLTNRSCARPACWRR